VNYDKVIISENISLLVMSIWHFCRKIQKMNEKMGGMPIEGSLLDFKMNKIERKENS